MKRRRMSIFRKTFLITTIMLLLIVMVAYILLFFLLPFFYKDYKKKQYRQKTETLIMQLEDAENEEQERELLTRYAQNNPCSLVVRKGKNEIFFQINMNYGISVFQQDSVLNSSDEEFPDEESIEITKETEEKENICLDYGYVSKNGERKMTIRIDLQPLNEAKEVIISIYPIACFVCLVFSFLMALLFSKLFVQPIRQIREMTRKMTRLDPGVVIEIRSNDEIGGLSDDINHLYKELLGTIMSLEREINNYSEAENQKIEFLRTVSHELKTPLASANALVEGIVYDVPPYSEHPKEYLLECKKFLDKAIILTKESLSLSPVYHEECKAINLKALINEIVGSYLLIMKSKQITYFENIPEDVFLTTKTNLFTKALSNIIANAVNYTDIPGKIEVIYQIETKKLMIENTCKPLSKEELQEISSPFYSGNKKNSLSNGLGLYIVDQGLHLLKLTHSFLPKEDQSGMSYSIKLP